MKSLSIGATKIRYLLQKFQMAKSKSDKLPHFKSLDDLVGFFDDQDFGAYWKQMPEVKFDVDIKRKVHLFAVMPI